MTTVSVEITIRGTVQGVGFRPFVARTASALGIKGSVCNTDSGVQIKAHGSDSVISSLLYKIKTDAPSLATIDDIQTLHVNNFHYSDGFNISDSISHCKPSTKIARDTAVCPKCLEEMRDVSNRRYNHPFINCTECGPRYSIINKIPYDRNYTSMNVFPVCKNCAHDFYNQTDRRYHAQPVCCPDCGPVLRLIDKNNNNYQQNNIIENVKELLASGKILAVKGIGGFHLACRADDIHAINKLRTLKMRDQKPFACMVNNLTTASKYAFLTPVSSELLSSPECPIVLVTKHNRNSKILECIAPNLSEIGLMLPYTPIHHLLFDNAPYDMLIMTSANDTSEPMNIDDSALTELLDNSIDAILTHNRKIIVRLDDTVVRPMNNTAIILRRGRGYVPDYFHTPFIVDGIIGLGAQMKNSISLGLENKCFVSEYLGTTDSSLIVDECWKTFERLTSILNCKPKVIVSDLHPSGLSEYFFKWKIPHVKVQHHHAHAAACMGENKLDSKTICVVYDGTGLGEDGTIWGGEILIADYSSFTRAAHLVTMPLVGNEASIINPGRLALAICADGYTGKTEDIVPWIKPDEQKAFLELSKNSSLTKQTSSMGRLIDSCAAIIDICRIRTYEGQPAIELESVADSDCTETYPTDLQDTDDCILMNGKNLLLNVLQDRDNGIPVSIIAARFHNAISDMTIKTVLQISQKTGIRNVTLSGGCFCNKMITERTFTGLLSIGLTPYIHCKLPPGDESISFGQVLIAASRMSTNTINRNHKL